MTVKNVLPIIHRHSYILFNNNNGDDNDNEDENVKILGFIYLGKFFCLKSSSPPKRLQKWEKKTEKG